MKVAYSNKEPSTGKDLQKQAQELEDAGKHEQAVASYKRMIKLHYRREWAYQRLMIIYRKQKDYRKEIETIDEAINQFSQFLYRSKNDHTEKIKLLSKKLTTATGLSGKTGEAIHQPEPIHSWQSRKQRLEKLMNRRKSKSGRN